MPTDILRIATRKSPLALWQAEHVRDRLQGLNPGLAVELAQRHAVPEALLNAALEFDKAYIPSRYPDAHPSGSPRRLYIRAEAERLVAHADKIVQ